MRYLFLSAASLAMCVSTAVLAEDMEEGSKVVAEGESCPDGMVVSGMTGGQDSTTKICFAPNTTEMVSDSDNVGDPDTAEREYTGE